MEPLLIVLVIGIVGVFLVLAAYAAAKRRKEMVAWAHAKGLQFSPSRDGSIEDRFPGFECLRQGSNRYGFNIMQGDWSGRPVCAFDYHYETHSAGPKGQHRTQTHHFSAVVLRSNLFLKPLFIRPEGFLDRITEFLGFDDIDFESAEFSRAFYVKAQDRRWAFDVIHTRTMQFLLDMPRFTLQFDGRHAIAYRSSTFRVSEFEVALQVISGVLERLPEYAVKQLKGEG